MGTALGFGSNNSSIVALSGTATFTTNDCDIKTKTNITGTSITFNNLTAGVNITQVDVSNVTVSNSCNVTAVVRKDNRSKYTNPKRSLQIAGNRCYYRFVHLKSCHRRRSGPYQFYTRWNNKRIENISGEQTAAV